MLLKISDLKKTYGQLVIFDNLNLTLQRCGIYLIQGKSGSGKTTLLNIIAGYESFDQGVYDLDEAIKIACIFQSYELIEELTVRDNIIMASDLFDEDASDRQEILEYLGLNGLLDHYPSELSQGQKQRVGIARALWKKPQVIICDEPTESLDLENKEKVLTLLKELSKTSIVIVATHEIELLKNYYDYYYEIKNHQLILIDKKRDTNKLVYHGQIHKPIKTKLYIQKIIKKRSQVFSLLLMIIMLIQIGLYQLDISIFNNDIGYDANNANSIYLKTDRKNIDRFNKVRPILSFLSLKLNNKVYKVNVFPTDQALQANQIIINQNVAKVLSSNAIGKKLTLTYQLKNNEYTVDYEIIDIVEETDVKNELQIYYSYEMMNNILKSKAFSEQYLTQYDYLINEGNYFELKVFDDIETTYYNLKDNDGYSVYHSILTPLEYVDNQRELYHYLFMAIEVILLLISLVYVTYSTNKEIKNNQLALSILDSLLVPLKEIKKRYLIEKIKYLLIAIIIPVITCLLINEYLLIYVFIMLLACILAYAIKLMSFKQEDISNILKDHKEI